MRVVPRENEEINETWIADRDRFGFEGIYSPERTTKPMVRINGVLQPVEWEVALTAAAEGMQKTLRTRRLGNRFLELAERHRRGDVPALAGRPRARHPQCRSSSAPARFPGGRGRGRISELGACNRRSRGAGGSARHRLESAPRDAASGASHPQGGGEPAAPRWPSSILASSNTCSLSPATAPMPDLLGALAAVVRAAAAAAGKPVPPGVREAAVSDDASLPGGRARPRSASCDIFGGARAAPSRVRRDPRARPRARAALGSESGAHHRRRQFGRRLPRRRRAAS